MAGAGLLQQLGIISAANAENFPPEDFQGLVVHNVYRMTIHCVGPVGFDPDATLAARDWATRSEQGTNAKGAITFAHDKNRAPYGENMAWGPTLTAAQACALWYAEHTLYDFNNPVYSDATGHFTQLVWASSRLLGMSMVRRGNFNLWVARYFPSGNVPGQFPDNVVPPLGGPFCALFRPGTSTSQLIGTVPPAPEPLESIASSPKP